VTPCRLRSIPTWRTFYRDLGQTYRKVVRAFADAGCHYLQLDEVNLTYLCDPKLIQQCATAAKSRRSYRRLRSHDQRGDVRHSRRHDHHHASVPRQLPLDFIASGGYEPVAETLFNTINVHGYLHGI
jgi:5-methyltetrahydropteroyltriglutamate--homocysteine methyltransferase